MSKRSGLYPHVRVDTAAVPAVAHAGGALLTKTARVAGIDRYLSNALRPWRKPLARHDPAKVLLDVAVSLALGGDACRDTALLRAESGVYGPVASDATISRTIAALAEYENSPARLAAGPQPDGPLFVTVKGTGYKRVTIDAYFHRLRDAADFTWNGPAPTLHDLRHTFATRQMIRSYTGDGADPAATLSLLATWLGHSDPSHTYWYVEAVPELLALAAHRTTTLTME